MIRRGARMNLDVPTTSAALHNPSTTRVTSSIAAVAHRQRARVAAGVAMCVGALAMVVNATDIPMRVARRWFGPAARYSEQALRTYAELPHQRSLLFAVWCTTALVYVLARGVLRLTRPRDVVDHRLAGWSLALPLVGASFLLPLTIHAVVGAVIGVDVYGSDGWVVVSLVIVGHAHLVLVALAGRAGWRMGTSSATGGTIVTSSPWRALAWTTAAAAVPGIAFYAIPPVVTFATGLAFVPAMYALAHSIAVHEGDLLRAR
jgi:hypothetical protein